jgi:hypothetical protein
MTDTWRLRKVNGSWAANGPTYYATAPGCPDDYHAMRDCDCRPFKSMFAARQFIADQVAIDAETD